MRSEEQVVTSGPRWLRFQLGRRHWVAVAVVLAVYAAITLAVLLDTGLVRFDWHVMLYHFDTRHPTITNWLNIYAMVGQRGPSAIVAVIWLLYRAWKTRDVKPLLVLLAALLLLNLSVGVVKIGLGRTSPHAVHLTHPGGNMLFNGYDIYPSGHTSNAVVTWGVLALLATRHRKLGAVLAGWAAVSVGVTTILVGTHWVTDVLAGWMAGLLVLLALPMVEPTVDRVHGVLRAWWTSRRPRVVGALPVPAQRLAQLALRDDEEFANLDRGDDGRLVGGRDHPRDD